MEEEILVYVDQDLRKLIPKFLAVQREQCGLMKIAFRDLDYDDLKLLGHRMKGSCGGYGFSILGDFALKIEDAAKAKDQKLLSDLIAQLENCLVQIKVEYLEK